MRAPAAFAFAVLMTAEDGVAVATRSPALDIEAGRRIYMEGVLPSGQPLRGTVGDDVTFTGSPAACLSCHRKSGLGTIEGGTITPPVTGDVLYRPVWRGRPEMRMARATGRNARGAYTDASLRRALVDGIGPEGHPFTATMPRYALSDAEADALVAYLKTLSSGPSPGADATTVRFATVVAGDVDPARRRALLDVMETFLRERNAGTRYEERRRTRPPMDMEVEYSRYRDWTLDVWTLTGPPASWRRQLDAAYQKQQVFAVISGVSEGLWAPIHEFCEETRVPCVFPVTDLPVLDERSFYTVYFSRGMTLEGELLAAHLASEPDDAPAGIVQVFREGRPGATAARAVARAITSGCPRAPGSGETGVRLACRATDVVLLATEPATRQFWERLTAAHRGEAIVAWLEDADLPDLEALAVAQPLPPRLFLSASLAPRSATRVPEPLRARTRLVHPYERPEDVERRLRRTRTWLRSRQIASAGEERVQAGAFFALSIVSEALAHNYGFFVREFMLEQFEGMASAMVVSASYPRVTLGAGQRFGSKGGYILEIGARPESPMTAVSGWIVP